MFAGGDPGGDSPGAMTLMHDDERVMRKKALTKKEYQNLSLEEREIPEEPDIYSFGSWQGSLEESPLKFKLDLDVDLNNIQFQRWAQLDNPNELKSLIDSYRVLHRMLDVNNPLNYYEEEIVDPETGHKIVQRYPRRLILTETLESLRKRKENPGFITGGYYELLPSNIRSHIAMRNVAVVCEFHHSQKSHREKEIMLNFVASLILPVKKEYEEFVMENLAAKLPQFNEERAREMITELENEEFDSDNEEIFDDHLHEDYIEIDFPEEDYDLHFAKWQKRERLRGVKMVYDDLEKHENGDFVGMPEGWRPSVYSAENMQLIENPLTFKTEDGRDEEEDEEPSTQELMEAGQMAVAKMKQLGVDLLEVSEGSSSEDEASIAMKKEEKLMEAGFEYLGKYRKEKQREEEELKKFTLKEQMEAAE